MHALNRSMKIRFHAHSQSGFSSINFRRETVFFENEKMIDYEWR